MFGLLNDILKGLPVNANLRAKVREAKEQNAALETENAILKDDNRALKVKVQQLEAEVVSLRDEIKKSTHPDTPSETETNILVYLADEETTHFRDSMAMHFDLPHARLDYFLEALRIREYITWSGSPEVGVSSRYELTPKGREFLFKNNLI